MKQEPGNLPLAYTHGDDFAIDLDITDDGIPVDLAGYTFEGRVQGGQDTALTVTPAGTPSNRITVRFPASAPVGVWHWWLKLTTPSGSTRTYLAGPLEIEKP